MYNIGDTVKINHDGSIGAVVGVNTVGATTQYIVVVNGRKMTFFEEQLSSFEMPDENCVYSAKDLNALLTARLILNPSISSLYSLNSAKIDYIPYQFRPVLKIVKSDSPRILIADGVGVGKTIEAGLVLKELEARFDYKSVLVICPRPLITEKKWQNELKRFGEKFVHIDGKQLKYCIEETDLDYGEWPSDYQKCIIPYSLFDEAVVCGTATKDGVIKKLDRKSLSDLKPFPKFDLVIIDEAHHIKNQNTYAYQAAQMFCDNAESIVLLTATPIQLADKDLFVLLNLLRPDLVFDIDSFRHMAEPNPFINEAAKIIRSNQENWQEAALEQLKFAGDTLWGVAMLTTNPTYQKAIRMLNRDAITSEQRVKLIGEVESLHTFANMINRTRRRDIGNFTLRKPETIKVMFTEAQSNLYTLLMQTQADILIKLHGDRGIRFMMTTIMRQAASCIHGLKPFLETILTRRFDELDISGLDVEDDTNTELGEKLYQTMSVPKIKEAVKQILLLADELDEQDNKLDALLNTIQGKQDMENNRVMVFSSFRHTLTYLADRLTLSSIRVGVVHGGVPDEERVKLRSRFMMNKNEKEAIDVLLFSEVGCEGLDYQFCDCMVNYDLPWNPQAIEQRIGRIDRNGQKSESVSIVNIITEDTIDCDIFDRCLSRIGVFNASIGDSEQILGDITKEIYNIAEQYILKPEERREKLQQLQDNQIRLIQEQQKMEDEKHTFFGLDLSENVIKKELQDATNIYLSAEAIERLVETYLEKRLGDSSAYILGEGKAKTLRLNADNRRLLFEDYGKLPKQANPVYKQWDQYLNNSFPFEKITFDGEYASENDDVVFIMPTHPLVKQALKCFEDEPILCSLKVKTDSLPAGEYPFIIYEWLYKGVKPDNKLQVVTLDDIPNKVLLEAIYNAQDADNITEINQELIDNKLFRIWQVAKNDYIEYSKQIIGYKLENLTISYKSRLKVIKERLAKETDARIIRMKQSQLATIEIGFEDKKKELTGIIAQSDIVVRKLAIGTIKVEK
ncbi:MAG: DEAD/DEAH box helicase [Clostridiales bacterium]|nr:DEAD/DEAH box helicase [Clostridiales bacterium]